MNMSSYNNKNVLSGKNSNQISVSDFSMSEYECLDKSFKRSKFARSVLSKKIHLMKEANIDYKFHPQNLKFLPGIALLESHLRNKVSDAVLSKIEGLCALYGALSETSSSTGFLSILTLYVKTHCHSSLSSQLKEIVEKLFAGYETQSSTRPVWLDSMSAVLTDWKLIVANPAFSKISRVLSLLVTLGAMDSKSINLGGFELFSIEAQPRQATAVDLIDALIDTITFFAEGAYQCFTSGSLRPLLFSSTELVKIEEDYVQKLSEWEFVRNGNLQKFSGKTESQFDKELKLLIETLHDMYKTMQNGTEKKIVHQRWEILSKIQTEYISVRVSGGLRKSPFCVKVFGLSGVGKSTFTDLTQVAVLKAMNMPCTSDYICTLNEADKYMSNYRSYITGIKIDDYGNTKKEFWDTSPSDWIIKICNNIREYAVMADVANKGKITIEPGCLTITTNVQDMHAGLTSYNPMSILRRAHVHVNLKVKPEFQDQRGMLDSAKVFDTFGSLDTINDIWNITIEEPQASDNGVNFNCFNIIKSDIDIFEYLQYIVDEARKHEHRQTGIVDSFQEPSNLVNLCVDCGKLQQNCECCEPQFGFRLAHAIKQQSKDFKWKLDRQRIIYESKVEDIAIESVYSFVKYFESSPYSIWTNWIPEQWFNNQYVKGMIMSIDADLIQTTISNYMKNFIARIICFLFVTFCFNFYFGIFCSLISFVYLLLCYTMIVETKKNEYFKHLVKARGVLPIVFKNIRDQHVNYACGAFAGLAVLYGIAQTIKALKSNISLQGKLMPRCVADIQERDQEANPWSNDSSDDRADVEKPLSDMSQSQSLIKTNVMQIVIGSEISNAFALTTNVILIPHHMLPEETSDAVLFYGKRKIPFKLNPLYSSRVGSKDLVGIYVPNTGPLKNALPRFAVNYLRKPVIMSLIGYDNDRKAYRDRSWWQFSRGVSNGPTVFDGSYYDLQKPTFGGQCMSFILSESKDKHILGFHIGGVTGTVKGCGVAVCRPELEGMISNLESLSDTHIIGPQARDLADTIGDVEFVQTPDIHYKSPIRYIEKDCQIEVYGSVEGRSTYRSSVIETPISATVQEVCGVVNKWGPPKFQKPIVNGDKIDQQNWRPWYESLVVSSKPSIGFDPALVDVAIKDYEFEMKIAFEEQKSLWSKQIKPLTDIETVSGIDGLRFIDSMVSKTSMGYPFGGPKRNYLIDLEPTEDCTNPREFTPNIKEIINELFEYCDNKQFINQPFNASLKDEPTKLTKDKVRVFQAAPVALQFAIRKYFLPLARFISCNPLLSECAVGINAHGPEWDSLSKHMAKFGDDRVIAGDYSKYDLRMPAQLTISAFGIMIHIAEWSKNYSAQDINRMKVIMFDVVYPLVAYNGDMLRLIGTNPSGQNMTVYLNSIVNSLLHRLAFYDCYSVSELKIIGKELGLQRRANFRDLVALATYGDDAKGSVRSGYDKFNHVSMANFLEANDMKFTMPDKESDPVPFMSRFRADFLKRKDRYDEDLGHFVGMLEEDSIFKSLMSILESKTSSPEEVCCQNVDGALREWFFHGREVFNLRLEQMKEIVAREDLICLTLNEDYDFRVRQWKKRYLHKED